MEVKEQFIKEDTGHRQPFRVPDGYFEGFASRMMQQLPEKPAATATPTVKMPVTRRLPLRSAVVSAACVVAAVLYIGVWVPRSHEGEVALEISSVADQSSSANYSVVDALADYSMLDAEDMYSDMDDIQ